MELDLDAIDAAWKEKREQGVLYAGKWRESPKICDDSIPELTRRIREQDATIAELRALCGDAADAIRTLEDTPHYIATEYESLRARLRAASKGEQ